MRPRRLALAAHALLVLALSAAACAHKPDAGSRFGDSAAPIVLVRAAWGDDASWASPSYDDAEWKEVPLYSLTSTSGTLWLRKDVAFADDNGRTAGLYVSTLAAFEVYWDGKLLGRSGIIDSAGRATTAGPIDNLFPLEERKRSPGRHLMAIRVAPLRTARGLVNSFHGLAVGDYAGMARRRVAAQLLPMASLGVFVVAGIHFLVLFRFSRRPSHLVSALLCGGTALLLVAESYRWILGYTADWHVVRLRIVMGLTFFVGALLPAFFVLEFGLPRRRTWIAAVLALLILALLTGPGYDDRCLLMFELSIAASLAAVGAAAWKRRRGVLPAAVGISAVALALVLDGYEFADRSFFLGFALLVLCMLWSLALQMQKQREEKENALLVAARLEIQLLKRNLQPHFLMNTLTAVMEWIEEDPATGARFLGALAEELRILSEISDQKLIPVRVELELCRAHLAIMSWRKGTRFALEADGVDGTALIPPAVLHTLLENAITHNRYEGTAVLFSLRQADSMTERCWTLDAPLRDASGSAGDGVGLRYIKARLEESFPGRWRLESAAAKQAWRTTIGVAAA